ncbi:hypothetical protein CISIN_1g044654mg, partial [Citrus sinensis]
MALKHVFFILALTFLIMANLQMQPPEMIASTTCWNVLMNLKSCSNEIVIFFLNSQADIGPDCCRVIDH